MTSQDSTTNSRLYNRVSLLITTKCNQRCPWCAHRQQFKNLRRRHYSAKWLFRHKHLLQDLDILFISGGEPTLHPQLKEIILNVRLHIKPKRLYLITNGIRAKDQVKALALVDAVSINGTTGNETIAEELRSCLAPYSTRVILNRPFHIKTPLIAPRTAAKPCKRWQTALYISGRLYPCCPAYGIPGAQSVPAALGWQTALNRLVPPCHLCGFSDTDVNHN